MELWRGLDAGPSGWGRCVATIGVFDGVHRGHRQIIARAVTRARESCQPSVVVTFDPHPSEVVRPGSHPAVLSPPRYKAELIAALGVDVLCTLPFTAEFSRYTPAEFVHEVLVEHLHAAAIVVGENFRFGHQAAGDVRVLAELGRTFGFAVEGVPLLTDPDSEVTISSTHVRTCVAGGDVAGAAKALGRPHRVEGVVVRGDGRGRRLGYPTANVEPLAHAAVPADGVYAGALRVLDQAVGGLVAPGGLAPPGGLAAISVGTNPTFAGRERRVEVFVLDGEPDLYGRHVAVEFTARLRAMTTFTTSEELVDQMARDVAAVRRLGARG